MTAPESRKPIRQETPRCVKPPAAADDLYAVRGPCESSVQHDLAAEYMRKAAMRQVSEAPAPPPRPTWPMFSGVFSFPFYLSTLGPWMYISVGLEVTALLLLFWLGPGLVLGGMSARLIGLPTCTAAILTFSYAITCCLAVIEGTFNGWDAVDDWPDLDWKAWLWSYGRVVVLGLQAGLVGLALQYCLSLTLGMESHLPMVFGTLAAFPFILLGALAAGEAWAPMAIGRVLASVPRLWWAWTLFYVETTPLIVGWTILTLVGLVVSPVPMTFVSCPALAALMLIYARLLGRLARLIGEQEEDDDDAAT